MLEILVSIEKYILASTGFHSNNTNYKYYHIIHLFILDFFYFNLIMEIKGVMWLVGKMG